MTNQDVRLLRANILVFRQFLFSFRRSMMGHPLANEHFEQALKHADSVLLGQGSHPDAPLTNDTDPTKSDIRQALENLRSFLFDPT